MSNFLDNTKKPILLTKHSECPRALQEECLQLIDDLSAIPKDQDKMQFLKDNESKFKECKAHGCGMPSLLAGGGGHSFNHWVNDDDYD